MIERSSLECRALKRVILAFAIILAVGSAAKAVTITIDPSITDTIYGVSTERTGGNDMVGMSVTAIFDGGLGGFSETLAWVATGGRGGGVFGRLWSLSVNGNTFPPDGAPDPGTEWVFTNGTGASLVSLTLDGRPGRTVFDRTFGGTIGTPGSELGWDFAVIPPDWQLEGTATYSRQVAVGGNTAVQDIWHVLTLQFAPGVLTAEEWRFYQDTDNHLVPEPTTVLLLSLGLIGLGVLRRVREDR